MEAKKGALVTCKNVKTGEAEEKLIRDDWCHAKKQESAMTTRTTAAIPSRHSMGDPSRHRWLLPWCHRPNLSRELDGCPAGATQHREGTQTSLPASVEAHRGTDRQHKRQWRDVDAPPNLRGPAGATRPFRPVYVHVSPVPLGPVAARTVSSGAVSRGRTRRHQL